MWAAVDPTTLYAIAFYEGETADTLAALRVAKQQGYMANLAICNVSESSLVRMSDLDLLTHAGIEIGVASTKAFSTQLVGLLLLTTALSTHHQISQETTTNLLAWQKVNNGKPMG